jgi:sRNA-binding carbon storage regulator CsrA
MLPDNSKSFDKVNIKVAITESNKTIIGVLAPKEIDE